MTTMDDELAAQAKRFRRPLLLSIAASVTAEAFLLVVYGMVLNPAGDLVAKAIWTLVFCGLGMGYQGRLA